MKASLFTAIAVGTLVFASAGSASATIIFGTGNPGGGLSTVQLPQQNDDDGSDFNLIGQINPDNTQVFITGNENIDSAASGQARIVATDGSTLNFLNVQLGEGLGADTFLFNLNNDGSTGSVTLFGVDQFGNTYESDPFNLGNGQNFFNLTTLDDQLITEVYFQSTGLTDVRQIRYGGIAEIDNGVPIPEPSAWALMIIGFGGAGAMLRRTRRHVMAL